MRFMPHKKARKKTNPCISCPALCCHDLATPFDRPRDREDIDDVMWQLHYDTVSIAIRNNRWFQIVKGRCIYLDRNDMCTKYEGRSQKCRDHNPPDCEKYYPWYDVKFETPEELAAHLEAEREKRNRKRRKR